MTRSRKVSNAIDLQRKVLPMTKKAFEALEEAAQEMDEVVTWVCDEAITLGINPTKLNWANAQSFLHAKVEDYVDMENKVKELGYTSLPLAIKALSQFKERIVVDLDLLPEVFHTVPQLYLRGRQRTSSDDPGFAPLTLRAAQREHRQVVQLLLEAWPLASEEVQDEMTQAYLTSSPEEFRQDLYDFLYRTDAQLSLESELLTEISKREENYRFETWSRTNEKKGGIAARLAKKNRRK